MQTETLLPDLEFGQTRRANCSITLAVCSNRIDNIRRHWRTYLSSLQSCGDLLVIFDVETDKVTEALEKEMSLYGVKVIINGRNLGLAASRNIALDNCPTSYLVFIDDDVTVSKEAISYISQELNKGTEVVGVRISGPEKGIRMPWYISEGQLHYLAIHNPLSCTLNTWGACMGLNVTFVKTTNIRFRYELGRKGRGLQCGDDTTFLKELKAAGAKEAFITNVFVNHNIDHKRLSLTYMLRRAYWQGRSEFRRRDSINGLKKEWKRFQNTAARFPRRVLLTLLYTLFVFFGVVRESVFFFQGNQIK